MEKTIESIAKDLESRIGQTFGGFSDLHTHLGSSCDARTLWEIAHEQGIALGYKNFREFENVIYLNDKIDHSKYLEKFHLTQKIQSTPYGVELSVYRSASKLYIDHNITNVEIRFNPMLRNSTGLYDLDQIILSAIKGKLKAESIYPIKVGIILETARNFKKEQSMIIAEKCLKYRHLGIVGFDMSGEFGSTSNTLDTHKEAFKYLEDKDIGITIHAGETKDSIVELKYVLDNLKVDRIGHGIRSAFDDDILEKLSKKKICLEVCPSSNVFTRCVDSMLSFKYIIDKLEDFNVLYTINTDGWSFFRTKIKQELAYLQACEIFNQNKVAKAVANSFNCSFNNNFRSKDRQIL